jgi:hypothetical protein
LLAGGLPVILSAAPASATTIPNLPARWESISSPGSGTTWRDISGNGNNGTLTNGPAFTGIGKQAAIVFDGTKDYVTVSVINATTELSVFSFRNPKPRSGSVYPVLIGKWFVTPGDNRSWLIGSQPGGIESVIVSSDGTYFNSTIKRYEFSSSFSNNIWSQVGFTFNNGILTPYLNGAPVNYTASINANITRIHTSSIGYTIGSAQDGTFNLYFSGSVASSQIYNRALSQFEVWQNFNALKGRYGIPDIVTNGLVLNLDAGNPYSYLSGSSGITWTNTVAVSSSISGTLVNGPVYANGAITFDGVDDECNIGNVLFNSASAATIDMWISIPSMSVNKYITAKGSAGDGIHTFILYTGPGPSGGLSSYIRFSMGNQSGSTSAIIEYGNLNFNQWYNFTFTYDGSFVRGYQNATSPQSSSLSGNLYTTTSPIQLASSKYGAQSACSFSNFKIYNRALSAAEITQNFNALRGRYGI